MANGYVYETVCGFCNFLEPLYDLCLDSDHDQELIMILNVNTAISSSGPPSRYCMVRVLWLHSLASL